MKSSFNTFYKTFSGSDTLVFISIPNTTPIVLGTITTLAYSTYRVKRPVTLLNKVNVAGFTRGQRTVAGTMIFTLINQHWVNELIEAIKCLGQFESLKPDELPLFDLMIVSANEYGAGVIGYIYGVDVTDDSGVISVNDYFTETTVSYIARDIDLLKEHKSTINQIRNYGDYTLNNYTLNINNSINILNTIPKKKVQYKSLDFKSPKYEVKDYELNINSLNVDEILCEFKDNNIKLFSKSYYQNEITSNFYNNITNNKVTINSILPSLLYNNEAKSYPKYIDLIAKSKNEFVKINIKVGE